jgi:hypothetical protein
MLAGGRSSRLEGALRTGAALASIAVGCGLAWRIGASGGFGL